MIQNGTSVNFKTLVVSVIEIISHNDCLFVMITVRTQQYTRLYQIRLSPETVLFCLRCARLTAQMPACLSRDRSDLAYSDLLPFHHSYCPSSSPNTSFQYKNLLRRRKRREIRERQGQQRRRRKNRRRKKMESRNKLKVQRIKQIRERTMSRMR